MPPRPRNPSRQRAAVSVGARERTLHRLAEMLLAYPAVLLSGERLADELGVSRSTVWHGMAQLRGYGVELSGHPGTGYQLLSIPDLLLPSMVASSLKTQRLATTIHHFFCVGSTQTLALEAARAGAAEGELFIAESQSAGRGRHGHSWESPAGEGLYCSLVLRPSGPPAKLLTLTLAAGLAAADGVREATGLEAEIRWPNDLLLGGKKFCGLLLEMSAEATRIQHAVLGFGVNVNQHTFPPELESLATSLALHARARPSRMQVLAAILRHLERRYDRLQTGGNASEVRAEFERRSRYARGLPVRVGEGEAAFDGVTAGLDQDGFLRVRLPEGEMRTVMQGGVRELAPMASPPPDFFG